jgi:hypothetical protein
MAKAQGPRDGGAAKGQFRPDAPDRRPVLLRRVGRSIGAEIGLSAEGVRKFAAKYGFVITAGPHVFRSFSFCALQESALQRLAADYGSTTNRVVEDLLKLALEADGCVARRLLHVRREAVAAA